MSELNWNEALKGWKVTFSIGHRPSDRWEVYTPKGCGGVVAVDSVTDWTVRELLDRMSAAPIAEPSPWTGGGLPPVGTVCEVNDQRSESWTKVDSILAHAHTAGRDVAVFQIGDYIAFSPADRFRPIRTPEQIAEEERKAAYKGMLHDLAAVLGISNIDERECDVLHALVEAGYRKAGDA